jgi:hypothetical protein
MVHCDTKYTRNDFLEFEKLYLQIEIFKMDFTTPQDYLGTYCKIFEMSSNQKKTLQFLMDFALVIPELMCCYAEEIFFGAMLMQF